MVGLLGSSSPAAARPAADVAAASPLLALGFVGDGSSHPLSQTFADLAAAQAVFPRAAALTEEIDRHALQRLVDLAGAGPAVVTLPDHAVAWIDAPILSGAGPCIVTGRGAAIVQSRAGADGWRHGGASTGHQAVYFAPLTVSGVDVKCVGQGGRAFDVEMNPTSGGWTMTDVTMSGWGDETANYWAAGATRGVGCSDTVWRRVTTIGKNGGVLTTLPWAHVWANDTALFPALGSYEYTFEDCNVGYYFGADLVTISTPLEGYTRRGGNVNECVHGLRTVASTFVRPAVGADAGFGGLGYSAPQYWWLDVQTEIYGTILDLHGVKNVRFSGGHTYMEGPTAACALASGSTDMIVVGERCFDVRLVRDSMVELLPGYAGRALVNAAASPGALDIGPGCTWIVNTGASALYTYDFGAAAPPIPKREYGNHGLEGESFTATGAAQRAGGNFSQDAIVKAAKSAGYDKGSLCTVSSDGVVTFTGSTAGPTGANGVLTVRVPAHVLTSSFIVACAVNGDAGAGIEAVSVVLGACTPTSLALRFAGVGAGQPRRVNFTVVS